MKILQLADPHLDGSTQENVEHAMAQILELARIEKPDLIVNCGDLAMKRGYLAPWVAEALRIWHVQLAAIAPVVVVAGNHDLTHDWERAGTLRGALSFSESSARVFLADRPSLFQFPGLQLQVACLPYPSKYALLAARNGNLKAADVNLEMGALLTDVVRGLAGTATGPQTGFRNILVYHGTIGGAVTGTEQRMTTEIDIVLPEPEIPEIFEAVLCGHIHKPQTIGRAVYAGSPCPLDFGEANHPHGVMIWESEPAPLWKIRFVELEPKHRLITIDLRETNDPVHGLMSGPAGDMRDFGGARIRILLRLPRGTHIEPVAARLEALAKERGAFECRLQVERDTDDRSAAPGQLRAEAALDPLLEAYAERTPEIASRLPALKALGAEIDGNLPAAARAVERYADYQLIALRWSNWKSFAEAQGEIQVEGLGRLVCIEGENASGKSNLMEVEAFALWGKLPRGRQPIGELVRLGAHEAWVEAEFGAGGVHYRARRSITVNARGDGKGLLVLERDLRGAWEPANAGDARETQAAIEELVGPFDLYLATRFASQGDIDRLLEMTGADLKDTIQAALGTGIFEHREAAAKARASEYDRRAAQLHGQADALTEHAGEIGTWQAAIEEHEAVASAAAAEKVEASRALQAASDELEGKRRELAEASEHATQRQGIEGRLQQVRRNLDAASAAREDLQARIDNGAMAAAALEEHKVRATELGDLAVEEARYLAHIGEAAQLRTRLGDRLELELRDIARRSRERESVLREQSQLKEHFERERKTASMIGTTPFGEACAERACSLLRLPIAARDAMVTLEAKHAESVGRLAALEKMQLEEASVAGAEIEELEIEIAGYKSDLEANGGLAEKIIALRAQVTGFDQGANHRIIQAGERAIGLLEALDREQTQLNEQGMVLALELEQLPAADILAAKVSEQRAAITLDKVVATNKAAGDREAAAREKLAAVKARLEAATEAREKALRIATEADSEFEQGQLAAIYARAMGRDGVPYLMLERALPAIEDHANRFLAYDDLKLEIEPARDLRTGEQRSEVYARYRDAFGLHGLVAASGFQRVMLGYALRAALAQVQAEAHGLRVSHWIADEGWSAASEGNLLGCQQMLRRLGEQFERVFFVSHQSEIREVADTRLRVVPNHREGSRLEVVT